MSAKVTVGMRFSRWAAIEPVENRPKSREKWVFQCDCGTVKEVAVRTVLEGKSRSCGCLRKELLSASKRAHGGSKEPLYRVWAAMLDRCLNPSCRDYLRYGGRGIGVHPEWAASYEAFRASVGPKPGPRYSLDRIDNDQGYVPGNVRWADPFTQANNKSSNRLITFNGVQKSVSEWARELGISVSCISTRLNREGLSVSEALTRPPRRQDPLYEAYGRSMTLTQWAKETGVHRATLQARIRLQGLTLEAAISMGSPGRARRPRTGTPA